MTTEPTRAHSVGKVLDILLWVQARTTPFTRHEAARALEIEPQCALRYLHCLEARDIVASDRSTKPWVWMATPIAEAQ